MPQDLIRYDLIVQDALKGVVRKVLTDAASQGMPGEHHFYISFRTQDQGVRISQRLRDKYPEEMTIVLQHQFWDLKVDRAAKLFSVGLSFGQIPSTLVVPFAAVTAFWDPAARIGLRFGGPEAAAPEPEAAPEPAPAEESKPQVVQLDAFRRKPARD